MFEDKNNIESDLMMRSILENGQEEVPAHVWDGVSAGLDKMVHRKVVALWWRRAAIGGVAAAAIAIGLFLNHNQDITTQDPETLAEAEEVIYVVENEMTGNEDILIAEAQSLPKHEAKTITRRHSVDTEHIQSPASGGNSESQQEVRKVLEQEQPAEGKTESKKEYVKETSGVFHDEWPEEEVKKRKTSASLVLSGVTGTNSSQNNIRRNMMRLPTLGSSPLKTGITETSTNSTYGIPLSFGAGVKLDFNSRWSLGIGVNYTLLTRKFYGKYCEVNSVGFIEKSTSSDVRNTQHYIGIPVNAYYNIVESRNVNLYAYAGGAIEKCISNRYDVLDTHIIHKEKVDGTQLSANLGIGVEFMLGKHLGLYADPSLRYYFDNCQPKSIRTAQPLMFGLEMGLRIRL